MPPAPRYLTKSLFKGALDCPLKLRHALAGCPTASGDDDFLKMLAEGGYHFEAYVRAHNPGVDFSQASGERDELSRMSVEAIARGEPVLHEATFVHGALSARCDMIRVTDSTVTVIEIKSRSGSGSGRDGGVLEPPLVGKQGVISDWKPYVADLAFQVHVVRAALQAAGIDKTVNSAFILPNKSTLAGPEDVMSKFTKVEGAKTGHGRPDIRFTGDPAKTTPLHMEVSADDAVGLMTANLVDGQSLAQYAESLAAMARGAKEWPAPPLSAGCNSCDYHVSPSDVPPGKHSGFGWCWKGWTMPEKHGLFSLYHFGNLAKTKNAKGGIQALLARKPGPFPLVTELDDTVLGTGSREGFARRQIQVVRSGKPYVSELLEKDPDAALRSKPEHYPLFFFDYEGIRTLVPLSTGRRPYAQTAFQWSCHVIDRPGAALRHVEFLDFESDDPSLACLRSLRALIGDAGTFYHWSNYEVVTTRDITEELAAKPDLSEEAEGLIAWSRGVFGRKAAEGIPEMDSSERIVDLVEVMNRHYYHPDQEGSFSIKRVLPVVWKDPRIRALFPKYEFKEDGSPAANPYDTLLLNTKRRPELAHIAPDRFAEVRNGTDAMQTYMKVRFGKESTDPELKAIYRGATLEYCELDTAAMVMAWNYLRKITGR